MIDPFDLFYHKNLTFHKNKTIENGGEIKYTLDIIIGTPRNSYE